ncbi:MAG TPA: hypothetical protein VKF80_00480 [Candidatus Eisenbacteria bacterium]|nr:hypothetical protein [Candidatus Eisenbacteria bacterium]
MERRAFLGWLGTISVAALSMSASGAGGQTPGKPPAAGAAAAPAPAGATPAAPTPPGPDAKDLLSIARRRYGTHLTDEQADELLTVLDRGVQASTALRKAKLGNGDEPDFVFRA